MASRFKKDHRTRVSQQPPPLVHRDSDSNIETIEESPDEKDHEVDDDMEIVGVVQNVAEFSKRNNISQQQPRLVHRDSGAHYSLLTGEFPTDQPVLDNETKPDQP